MTNEEFELLDELRIMAQNGLRYADDPYDEERYERILELVAEYYGELDGPDATAVHDQFADRLGHVTPNVGARAAVFDDQDRVLLLKRSDDGKWGLPGWFTEPGETPRETAIRETREETGLDVEPVELVDFYYRRPDEHNPHGFVGCVFLGTVVGGRLDGSHESEALEYRHPDEVAVWHKDTEEVVRDAREVRERRQDGRE